VKLRIGLVLSALASGACSGSQAAEASKVPEIPPAPARAQSPRSVRDAPPSARVALVPSGTFGPYVGDRPESTILVWSADVDGQRRWLTVGLNEAFAPASDPITVANASPDVDLVAVKPLGDGPGKGFVVITSSREFRGERVDAIALGPRGELRGGPTPLAEALADVVWVDAVPTPSGAIALWASRRDDRADIYAVELGPSGEARDEPSRVVSDARSWQTARISSGAAVGAVLAGKERDEPGPIRLVFVDAHGVADKKSATVSERTTSGLDLDFARMGDRLVFAWSDERDLEARLYSAVVDESGAVVKPPAPLGRAFGPQAVLRIVPPYAGRGPAYLAWENFLERPESGRVVRLAALGPDGTLGAAEAALDLEAADANALELEAKPTGVLALTRASECKRGAACDRGRIVPTFVDFDAGLGVVASEPLRVSGLADDFPELAWGLTCKANGCMALAAGGSSPLPIYAVKLGRTSDAWQPAARRAQGLPPRAITVQAIGRSDSVADLAVVRTGSGSLVAWVSNFDSGAPFTRTKTPAPDGKYEAPRAVLELRALPDAGEPPEATVLSYRAASEGGVAVAPGDPGRKEALVGWVGIDNREPEVFLTLVGEDGKKLTQKMLTHGKHGAGGVSEVALATVADGWVVAWIDDRGDASQIYVSKVDRSLRPIVGERRLGASVSNASDVRLLSRGEHVFAVWSDARGPTPGVADVYAARISAKDLSPIGPEHPVATTPMHSASPVLAALGEGAVVAWLEEPLSRADGARPALMMTRLDSGAEPVAGSDNVVPLAGAAEAAGIVCGQSICRIAVTVSDGDRAFLSGFEWRPNVEPRATELLGLMATPRGPVAPVPVGDDVFYADTDPNGANARIRRAGIEWQ
jgi:hypothetical protein